SCEGPKAAPFPPFVSSVGLMAMVHSPPARPGPPPRPPTELPPWGQILRRAYLALPFGGIVFFLAAGYSPTKAAFYVILVTVALSCLDRRTWMTPTRCLEALVEGAAGAATRAVALAGSGRIGGVLP